MASGPRCFRWRMFTWSGPVELLLADLDIAYLTCIEVMRMGVEGKALVCLLTFLSVGLIECLAVLTNCSLKAVAICCGSSAGLQLKLMALLGCEGGLLPFK